MSSSARQRWSFLSLTLLRYPQALLMILLVGITAPPLIAHDVRSRAFLIYFSRPILRWEYILGKMGTVAFFLAMIIAIPTLLLYVAGVVLSPGFSVVLETWDLPIRIIVTSIAVIIPTTAVALMLSSLTTESRYAGFGWFAIWIIGYVTYGALSAFSAVNYNETSTDTAWQALFSPYHTLGIIQSWIFDLHLDTEPVVGASVLLIVVTIISLLVVYRRVSLPLRA